MKKLIFVFLLAQCFALAQPDSVEVVFSYPSDSAKSFAVAGSFNNWTPASYNLKHDAGNWQIRLKLPQSYYYYKFVVDGNWIPDPLNPKKVNDGGDSYNSILKAGNPPRPVRKSSGVPFPKEKFPEPVLTADTAFVQLYYAALQMAWNKISHGTKENGFSENYMDEGFNELIYQWDTNFMVAFGMYFPGLFPAMSSLNNFYIKQRPDGYIQRVYWETTGKEAAEPTKDEPLLNPPLFAWMELRYYQLTGDTSRLRRVLPVLTKYFTWIENHSRTKQGTGLYHTSPLGSGMDNTPRPNGDESVYVDLSLQQALAARCINELATVQHDNATAEIFAAHHKRISDDINRLCWDTEKHFYFDLAPDYSQGTTKHIGAFWSLIAGTPSNNQASELIQHLTNPKEFWRNHLVPTLSADDPHFNAKGHYWLGSVWAPTNYMLVKGLEKYGYEALADSIALNHIRNMCDTYKNFNADEESICYEERYGDGYHTIWECYSSDNPGPATRWDNTYYSRQDFVGWSGLGPIAMLIENVLGFSLNGAKNEIVWRIHRTDKHGIENLNFAGQNISLIAAPTNGQTNLIVRFEKPFTLTLITKNRTFSYNLPQTEHAPGVMTETITIRAPGR